MNQHRVFVYGTLMSGLRNHHKMGSAKFCGEANTLLPAYDLQQFPSQSSPGNITPGLRRNGTHIIAGEVYLVDDELLAALDALEDVGHEYERGKIMLADGSKAWSYFLIADKPACPKGTPLFMSYDEGDKVVRWDGASEEATMNAKRAA